MLTGGQQSSVSVECLHLVLLTQQCPGYKCETKSKALWGTAPRDSLWHPRSSATSHDNTLLELRHGGSPQHRAKWQPATQTHWVTASMKVFVGIFSQRTLLEFFLFFVFFTPKWLHCWNLLALVLNRFNENSLITLLPPTACCHTGTRGHVIPSYVKEVKRYQIMKNNDNLLKQLECRTLNRAHSRWCSSNLSKILIRLCFSLFPFGVTNGFLFSRDKAFAVSK